jgi:hypothetical protein
MLRDVMDAQMSETQKAREELRRAENDLNVTRIEKGKIEIPLLDLRAEVADLKFQNSRLTSENKRLETEMEQMANEYRKERRKIVQHSGKHDSVSSSGTNAVAGPSRITSQRIPTNSPYADEKHHGDFTLAMLMQRELDEEAQQDELLQHTPAALFECGVCMDEKPDDYVTWLDPCGHKFCRDCIRNHVGAKLAERCFPILCPVCMAEGGKGDPGSA